MFTSYSSRLVQQLQGFVWVNAKPQALKDSHDDLIISIAIGMYIVGATLQGEQGKSALAAAMLAATSVSVRRTDSIPRLNDVQPSQLGHRPYESMTSQDILTNRRRTAIMGARLNPAWSWLLKK